MESPPSKRTGIGKVSAEVMRNAVYDIEQSGISTKAAAMKYGIPRTTLRRYLKKCRNSTERIDWSSPILEGCPRMTPNYSVNKIFSTEEEQNLCVYLKTMANLHHGLTPKTCRKLGYDLAVANKKKIPFSWQKNQTAGKDWFTAFLKRNKDISIRAAEATSLGRAMGFNKPVVTKFFENLKKLCETYKFQAFQVYNVDETALTTVQNPGKVLATKGQKQVGQITSGERGTLVTMVGAINAGGNSIPPLLIFPRKYFKAHMIKSAPPGTVGSASPSGWITSDIFVEWFRHFIYHAKPSIDCPLLLLMDNHESHVSLAIIELARKNHVKLLTLPPHTSHKLQPLDKSVYGPLKRYYNNHCQSWLLNNVGKRITIYDIAEILGLAYPMAFCTRNSISGFRDTGIFPFNDTIFSDDDFLASKPTDIPENELPPPSTSKEPLVRNRPDYSVVTNEHNPQLDHQNLTAESTIEHVHQTPEKSFVSPEQLLPYPQAKEKETNVNRRKKKSTEILTDTPVYERIKEERQRNESKIRTKKTAQVKRQCFGDDLHVSASKKGNKQKAAKLSSSESSDSDVSLSDVANSDDVDYWETNDSNKPKEITEINVNSFVLVKFTTKKTIKYYVGKVIRLLDDGEYEIRFLRRHGKQFVFPDVEDVSSVLLEDIELHLPDPYLAGGTARASNTFTFSIDLSSYIIN